MIEHLPMVSVLLFAFRLCFCLDLLLHCGEYYFVNSNKHAQGSHNAIIRQTETNHDAKDGYYWTEPDGRRLYFSADTDQAWFAAYIQSNRAL